MREYARNYAKPKARPSKQFSSGLCLCFGLLLFARETFAAATKESPAVAAPPGAEIIARLHKEHPRLLASREDFAALKKGIGSDPKLQDWKASLEKQAKEIIAAAPSRYEIPDGLRLLATSRRVVDRVYTLALLYRLDGDAKYAERAWAELEAAAKFPNWNTRHFLDTAEMTHAFAIGYDWLYDVWTEEQRATLRQAMAEKGLTPALELYRKHAGYTRMRHNWNQVCNGGIGMGALAIAEADPQLAGEILHDVLESLPLAMGEFAPDGAWKEGPGYWNYATSYNVTILAGLQSALGTDFGLSKMAGFGETGFFPIYLSGPIGRTFNFADGHESALHAPQLFWLAQRFNQPIFGWVEQLTKSPQALDVLWYQSNSVGPKEGKLPPDRYFRGAEVATIRSEWENPKALFIGFKAGDNKANHSHLDLGSFVFDALGARWAMDLGSDDYNLPGYFGTQRFTYYRLRAEGQNTLLINPGLGPDQDPAAAAKIIRFQSEPESAYAIADLTAAYKQNARKVCRGISMPGRNELLVQDEIQADKPADVWWFMHTPAVMRIEEGGRTATLKQVGIEMRAELLSPANAVFEIMDAQPLPSSPHPERQARNESIKKLTVHLSGVRDARVAVRLLPGGREPTAVSDKLEVVPLAEW